MRNTEKLLVVDDDVHQRRLIERVLTGILSPSRVIYATDGIEGLRNALAELPSLILTDFNMPRMNGDELIRNLKRRKNEYTPHIVLSSTYSLKELLSMPTSGDKKINEMVQQALRDKEIEFLPKDYDFDDYSKALEDLVTKYLLPANTVSEIKLP